MGDAIAIGISCGGPLDSEKGVIMSPPNLPGWDDVPIVKILQEAFEIPTFLQNDADAGALAEWKFGAGMGTKNMVFLTFGTGMGAGLILNGALYSGACGCAGEVGHIRLTNCGPIGYGKEGSFEGFCSGGGIAQLGQMYARELLQKGQIPSYCSCTQMLETITAKAIAESANEGHADAIHVYRRCGQMLGKGLSILVDLLNPEKIIIGSIFARSEHLLRAEMQQVMEKECLAMNASACKIVPAALGESIGDIAALSVAINGLAGKGRKDDE